MRTAKPLWREVSSRMGWHLGHRCCRSFCTSCAPAFCSRIPSCDKLRKSSKSSTVLSYIGTSCLMSIGRYGSWSCDVRHDQWNQRSESVLRDVLNRAHAGSLRLNSTGHNHGADAQSSAGIVQKPFGSAHTVRKVGLATSTACRLSSRINSGTNPVTESTLRAVFAFLDDLLDSLFRSQ